MFIELQSIDIMLALGCGIFGKMEGHDDLLFEYCTKKINFSEIWYNLLNSQTTPKVSFMLQRGSM
jgi:hypothetical protein